MDSLSVITRNFNASGNPSINTRTATASYVSITPPYIAQPSLPLGGGIPSVGGAPLGGGIGGGNSAAPVSDAPKTDAPVTAKQVGFLDGVKDNALIYLLGTVAGGGAGYFLADKYGKGKINPLAGAGIGALVVFGGTWLYFNKISSSEKTTTPPTDKPCQPRPACMDSNPPCSVATPAGGWCKADAPKSNFGGDMYGANVRVPLHRSRDLYSRAPVYNYDYGYGFPFGYPKPPSGGVFASNGLNG